MQQGRRSRLAQRRKSVGLSQDGLAELLGVERSTVVRWETGRTAPQPWVRPHLADALAVTLDQVHDLLGMGDQSGGDDVDRREFNSLATGLALAPLVRPRFGRVGSSEVLQLQRRTARLRRLDDHLGGIDTYQVYASEVRATEQLVERASYNGETAHGLAGVLAEQAQMAGWAAFDGGRYADARRHYGDAMRAAQDAAEPGLIGNTLAFMAYEDADVDLATASCREAGDRVTPRVRALLNERRARTHARSGDADATDRALGDAVEAVRTQASEPEPDWVFWVDDVEVEIMSGRCWTELRQPHRAVSILSSALERYDDTHARDKALYLTWLAQAHMYDGEIERATDVTAQAIDLTAGVGSVRPGERVGMLLRALQPHRKVPAVASLYELARD